MELASSNGQAFNWSDLWVEARRRSTWTTESCLTKSFWDRQWGKSHADHSERIEWILHRLEIGPNDSVLDIGAGPGLLTIPLAEQARLVTAVEQSEVAASRLKESLESNKLNNVRIIPESWLDLDVGKDVDRHDVVLAAYALGTVVPKPFIEKMIGAASRRVVIVEPAGPRHWQHPDLWPRLTSMPFDPGPDYIYIVNLLHEMGFLADVVIGEYSMVKKFKNMDEAVSRLVESFERIIDVDPSLASDYLAERVEYEGNAIRLVQRQQLAMITVNIA